MPDRTTLTKLARLARDPGATEPERAAAKSAYDRLAAKLGPTSLVGEVKLAEHGSAARATICNDDCAECAPLRARYRATQKARNDARKRKVS